MSDTIAYDMQTSAKKWAQVLASIKCSQDSYERGCTPETSVLNGPTVPFQRSAYTASMLAPAASTSKALRFVL